MIHYHGSPVSGPEDKAHRFYANRHVMVSFAAPKHIEIIAEVASSFVIDNGAFSTWSRGEAFDLDAYYEFCERWLHHPACDWAIVPDVIDGTAKENDQLLFQWPFARELGMPVYHLHEPPGRFLGLCNWRRSVAIGSSGKWPTPGTDAWWDRIAEIMPAICNDQGQPRAKLHGLRMLDPEIFGRLPLHSADSVNAAMHAGSTARFGIYPHPEAYGRGNVIADRVEAMPFATCWKPDFTPSLFQLSNS